MIQFDKKKSNIQKNATHEKKKRKRETFHPELKKNTVKKKGVQRQPTQKEVRLLVGVVFFSTRTAGHYS